MQPDKTVPTPEAPQGTSQSPEIPAAVERQQPAPIEQAGGVGASAVPTAPTVQPPVPVQPTVASATLPAVVDPSLANLPAEDADVIEKEWVDKSDEIIASKQDDPRAEDDAQHNLSRAYLKKRFNLDVE